MAALTLFGFHWPAEYLVRNTPGKGRLTFLSLDLTSRCCARCLYCFSAPELGHEPERPLSLREYQGLIEQARVLGLKTVAYPGVGEPLLDPKIGGLIEYATRRGVASVIYTCGLISPETLTFLRRHDVTLILKVDTLCPKTYERLVGVPFARFRESLERILHAYSGSSEAVDGLTLTHLAANTVVTRLNKQHVGAVADLCEQHGVAHFVETLSKVGGAEEHWDELVGEELAQLLEVAALHGHWVSSATLDGRCGLYAHGITIDVNGDLLACPTARWIRLGNVREHSLRELIALRNRAFPDVAEHYCAARALTVGVDVADPV